MKIKFMPSAMTLSRKIACLIMLAFAAGALFSARSARVDAAVPFMIHGHMTIVVNFQDVFVDANGDLIVPALVQETGKGTDLGLYINIAHALHDLTTDWTSGEGQFTAANSDTLNFTFVQPPNSPTDLTFNGGTGRFANATGSATAQGSYITTVQQGTLLIMTEDITTVGTISY